MKTIISIDISAAFGFLKKPDINDGIYLTYNSLHKPAIQGILGAILGFSGYSFEGAMKETDIPEYRKRLENLRIGIMPLQSSNGNFQKETITYTNTVGYANVKIVKRELIPQNLIINEQTLLKPSYRLFLELDDSKELQNELKRRLRENEAEFIPYLGKNEHQLWWSNFREWEMMESPFQPKDAYKIDSLFLKETEDERLLTPQRRISLGEDTQPKFVYFERLPKGWSKNLPQYDLGEFLFTNYSLDPEVEIPSLISITDNQKQYVVQLF